MAASTALGRRRIVVLALVAACALSAAVVALLVARGGGSSGSDTPAAQAATATPKGGGFLGGEVESPKPAPPIALRDPAGRLVTLQGFRGHPVLVTFLYTNCPDVCPLTANRLRATEALLSPSMRKDVRIIAVSVDPRHDTPTAVRAFLARHGMTGRMDYLIGSAAQLRPTWARWGVSAATDTTNPNFVAHSALVYGVGASGKLLTIYPYNLRPADLAHDVGRLASA